MRVAVVTWSSKRVGGVEEYLSILLPALHRAGHEVALWHEVDEPGGRASIDVPAGVATFCAATMGAEAAFEALRRWNPGVLFCQGLSDPALASRLTEIAPSVFFLHNYVGTCISGGKTFTRPTAIPCHRRFGWPCLVHYFPHGCGGRSPITMWRQFARQSSQQDVLRQQAAIVTHTEHLRGEMERHGLRAEVIPFPIAAHTTSDTHSGSRGWRLLFAGRMDFLKGGVFLLDALPDVVAAAKKPVHLTLAGDGPHRAHWETRAQEIQAISSRLTIEFTGWVTQEQIATLMTGVDLLVVPSVWPEPFGTVGPAAAQHGVPAAAFAVGGIPQWLVDGASGHLAAADPPTSEGLARAIVRCLDDPLHYTSLQEGARKMARQFTMERHLPALLAVLARAASSRLATPPPSRE